MTFEYAPAPESRAVVDIASSYGLFIDGAFVDAKSGLSFKTVNPATEEVLAEVSEAGPEDVDRAVAAARLAYENVWGPMSGRDRAKYLFRIARLIQERSRELAVLESLDNGKPIRESRDVDVPLVAAHFFYHAGWADKLEYAGYGPTPRPLGVAAQVIPWNFPLLMLAWKVAPALACGNTVVLKPAETTPLTALAFADICRQADLPPGVVNILTGAGETGRLLVEHPGVDKVAFTGSTEVGKAIMRSAAGHRQAADARARRQGGERRLRRRPDRPGRRGDRQRHLLQPGPCLLRGLAAAAAGVRRGRGRGLPQASTRHAAARRPPGQEHRHRCDQLVPRSSPASTSWSRAVRTRAPSGGARPARSPSAAGGSRRRCSPA